MKRSNNHLRPAAQLLAGLLLTLAPLSALAGGWKISDADFTKLMWVLAALSTPFWLFPLLGILRLLTRRRGLASNALGVLNLIAALLWLGAAKFVGPFVVGTLVCGAIGVALLQGRTKAELTAEDEAKARIAVENEAAAGTQAAEISYSPPLTDSQRGWAKMVAWVVLLMLAVVGVVVSNRRSQERAAGQETVYPENVPATVYPENVPETILSDEPIEYATPEEVRAAARRRGPAPASAWDTPASSRPDTSGWAPESGR